MVLRLRGGGGGFTATILNIATQEKNRVSEINYYSSFKAVQEKIAKTIGCNGERVLITKIGNNAINEGYDEDSSINPHLENFYDNTTIVYGIGLDFRDIITCF